MPKANANSGSSNGNDVRAFGEDGPATLSINGPGADAMSNSDGSPLDITLPATGKHTISLAGCWAYGGRVLLNLQTFPPGGQRGGYAVH
jgi:hypothetical protein